MKQFVNVKNIGLYAFDLQAMFDFIDNNVSIIETRGNSGEIKGISLMMDALVDLQDGAITPEDFVRDNLRHDIFQKIGVITPIAN